MQHKNSRANNSHNLNAIIMNGLWSILATRVLCYKNWMKMRTFSIKLICELLYALRGGKLKAFNDYWVHDVGIVDKLRHLINFPSTFAIFLAKAFRRITNELILFYLQLHSFHWQNEISERLSRNQVVQIQKSQTPSLKHELFAYCIHCLFVPKIKQRKFI